jgi:CheY-like chemotaxis protein
MNTTILDILLVDDDKINQMIMSTFLRRWGMRVTIANNGQEAVILILEKKFQIVLMDLQMPGIDGFEATSIIRGMDDLYFKTVPIIAFTASIDSGVCNQAIRNGATDILCKTFEVRELREKLEEYANALPLNIQQITNWENVAMVRN